MGNGQGDTIFFCLFNKALEMFSDACGVAVIVQKNIAADIGHLIFHGDLLGNAGFGGIAIDKIEAIVLVEFLHQPQHMARVLGEQAAHVIVDASNMRYRAERRLQLPGKLFLSHVEG